MGLNRGTLVAPFLGERYAPGVPLSDVIAPPYDVLGEAERRVLAARHPHNVVHVILPEGDGDRYQRAARLLGEWRAGGVLVRDREPSLHVLRQRFATPEGVVRERTGVIAAVSAEPFAAGRVRPHERTHPAPKQDRLALLRATQTMCEALLFLMRDSSGRLRHGLGQATRSEPLARAELEGVEIALWRASGANGEALAAGAPPPPLYIADGHHRYETTVAYCAENPRGDRALALIVPLGDPGLVVLPTHRIIAGSPLAAEAVLGRLAAHFGATPVAANVEEVRRALSGLRRLGGGCVLVLRSGEAYRLTRLAGTAPAPLAGLDPTVRALDVAWVDGLVVPVLAENSGSDGLRYTPDLRAALDSVRAPGARAAVLLGPAAVEDVLAVADAGALMPPKATFFTPKIPSGLVLLNYGAT